MRSWVVYLVPIWLQRWWSLKPFLDKGVDHFMGTSRDARHLEFLETYWKARAFGGTHAVGLKLGRLALRIRRSREWRYRIMRENHGVDERLKDALDRVFDRLRAHP